MLLIGIDEVGYGCRLGPFIAAGVAVETPHPDLWDLLKPEVGRAPRDRGIVVCDSKKLYTPAKGVGGLEKTALAFLPGNSSFRELCSALGSSIDGEDVPLPLEKSVEEIESDRKRLAAAMQRAEVKFLGARVRIVEPAEFNAGLERLKNKHDLHVETVLGLLGDILAGHDSLRASAQVGKLSARTFYLRALTTKFGAATFVRRETHRLSSYVMDLRGREVEVSFVLDGDQSRFEIALASVIGKYVRECWMKRFNAFWARHAGAPEPTTGYGTEAVKFWKSIQPKAKELRMESRHVFREK